MHGDLLAAQTAMEAAAVQPLVMGTGRLDDIRIGGHPGKHPLRIVGVQCVELVLGGIVFGAGWALSGSCPGPVLAMSVGGTVLGGVVMLGLWAGTALRDRVAPACT